MATRLTRALGWLATAGLAVALAACGAEGAVPATPAAVDESVATRPRPAIFGDLPRVELVAPGALNAGAAPVFEWRGVDGAALYRLSVRGPDDLTWAWQGSDTAVRYGGVAEGQPGPAIVPGMLWSVAAFAADSSLVAISDLRPVSPSGEPGPAPGWLAGSAASGGTADAASAPEAEPSPVAEATVEGPCGLLTGDEIGAAIDGTWGTPDGSDAVGIQGSCTWTSANGSLLNLFVGPADHYDPDGWGADETFSGLGDRAYRVTHGWDRKIGFVRGDLSVLLLIDYVRVDPDGFDSLARLVADRLP